jgi:cytochrome c oxidase assembly factor 1
MQRLPNRELPTPDVPRRLWLRTLPIFIFLITVSSLAIFNYQKSSSSTVNSILYALRTSPSARELLGDEVYFASKVPWISGELNQLHGIINVSFWVKGTKGKGQVKFVSVRKKRDGYFETLEWSLKMEDGKELQLLDMGERDPMAA